MKIFTYIIITLALIIIGFNVSQLNFKNILEGDSLIALISIIAVLCAVVILLIFRLSKSIDEKLKNQ
jgi:predicted permease